MQERMRVRFGWTVAVVLLCAGGAGASGLRGRAYVRLADGAIGGPIANVRLVFVSEDSTRDAAVSTGADGRYAIELPAARYSVRAEHGDFEDYSSAPGFAVVSSGTGTLNVFLREPRVTSVLIVRHAEKQDPASNDPAEPLSAAGAARADALRAALFRSGVSAIYSTDTRRTRDTVEPLRARLRLATQLYDTPAQVAAAILADHRGDVVLVAAHSNTVAAVANALGGVVPAVEVGDFDNLYAVARTGATARVVNFQYGADSAPDVSKNSGGGLTLLLARQVSGANPPEARRLLHACAKAGLRAIHVNGAQALVRPLAAAAGLTPRAFTSATLDALVDGLVAHPPAGPVLIVGSRDDLRAVVQRTGAQPVPIVYGTDRDNLILITRAAAGEARTVSLLY